MLQGDGQESAGEGVSCLGVAVGGNEERKESQGCFAEIPVGWLFTVFSINARCHRNYFKDR